MSDDHPESKVFCTFSIADDDECVIDDGDDDIDNDHGYDDDDNGVKGDEQHIHDQLPSVEEIKSSQAYISTANIIAKSNRQKQIYVAAGIGIATVIIIAIVSVAASRINHSKNKNKNVNNDVNLVGDSIGNVAFYNRLDDVKDYLWKNKISVLPSLIPADSPEHYAAVFMADGDNYQSQMVHENEQHFIERYIIALIYYGMNGPQWTNQYDFLHAKDHCLWTGYSSHYVGSVISKGVECNEDGYVIGIDLSNNNLISRSIPKEMHRLLHLEKLHFQHNKLGGNIPDLRMISGMKSIGLMDTGITGSIPDWIGTSMHQLTTLGLGRNTHMHSTIPESFKELVNMRILALDGMNLKGDINALRGMKSLEGLYLEDNFLTSGLIGGNGWSQMKELDLSGNMLSGSIPDSLFQYSQLQILDLNDNLLTGDFPQDIMMNDSIEYISMHRNSLTGQLSDRIGYLTNLQHLDVGGNLLTGTMPDTIKQLTNMVTLSTAGNNFTSSVLYDYFSGMTQLQDLSLKANNFRGTLPHFLGEVTSLVLLDLDDNALSGTIPNEYGSYLTNLHTLMLNRNRLTGKIPSVLSNLPLLKVLLLDNNDLRGKTTEICFSHLGMQLDHFITDCYPGKNEEIPPEVECRCCTLCCNDDHLDCNNKNWMVEKDFYSLYGSMSDAYYLYDVEEAPKDGAQKATKEASSPAVPAAAAASTSASTAVP